ncbi:MAG: outer membrane protein transport protein, partial [Primorskyibacter sp.]
MKRVLMGASALALCTGMAQAAGLDRSGQSIGALYADDGTFSLGLGTVTPSVTGTDALGNSYDVGERYNQLSLSYTNRINDQFSYTFLMDQPYGANTTYNNNPASSMLGGTTADLSSQSFSFIGKYQISDRISVHGGLRAQAVEASVSLNGIAYQQGIAAPGLAAGFNAAKNASPAAGLPDVTAAQVIAAGTAVAGGGTSADDATYALIGANQISNLGTAYNNFGAGGGYQYSGTKDWSAGYLLGAAYEIPEIAFRLSATYFSKVSHTADTTET